MTDHAHRRKRAIVLALGRPPTGGNHGLSHRTRAPSARAGVSTLSSPMGAIWFRATAAAVLVTALFMQIGHARADGSLITTSVQVSLKIQQTCQIDSTDAAALAAGVSTASTASTAVAAAAAPRGTSAAAATTLASAGTAQASDAAPKVSCQFDEPYGMLSSTTSDPTGRSANGAAAASDGTFQVASFWTVLF